MRRWTYGGPKQYYDQIDTLAAFEKDTIARVPVPQYHGTPLAPQDLRGHLILAWQPETASPTNTGAYPESATTYSSDRPSPFPMIRSLFHHLQPGLQGAASDFYLFRATNLCSEAVLLTGRTAVESLLNANATGYVYGCDGRNQHKNPLRNDLDEYRGDAMRWFTCTQVTMFDIPATLQVIDDSSQRARVFIDTYQTGDSPPDALAEKLGICVEPYDLYLHKVA